MPSTPTPTSPGLLTGHAEIDLEHGLLLACVGRLEDICRVPTSRCSCRDCEVALQRACHADLGDLLGDLLVYLLDHFRHEEALMRSSGAAQLAPEFCERHKEDHAAISLTIQELTEGLNPLETLDLVRRLQRLLGYWLRDHIARHDAVLVRFLPASS